MRTKAGDRGFTLVELLIVIVILGVLATITVFAVRGITDRGKQNACASDAKIMRTAEESRDAVTGLYTDEATLESEGYLHEVSQMHDLTVSPTGDSYTIVNVGTCAGAAAVTTAPPVSTPPASVLNITVLGSLPAQVIGTGPTRILYTSAGSAAGSVAASKWSALVASNPPWLSIYTMVWVDTRSLGDTIDLATLEDMIPATGPSRVINQNSAGVMPIEVTLTEQAWSQYSLFPCHLASTGDIWNNCIT